MYFSGIMYNSHRRFWNAVWIQENDYIKIPICTDDGKLNNAKHTENLKLSQ